MGLGGVGGGVCLVCGVKRADTGRVGPGSAVCLVPGRVPVRAGPVSGRDGPVDGPIEARNVCEMFENAKLKR